MASFWGEIRRRKVFQVAVAYAIAGWLVAQVAATTFPILLLPDWILRAFVILLLLGFPIAVVLAWAFERTPEGIQRDQGQSAEGGEPASMGRSGLYVAGAFVAGLAIGGYFGRGPEIPEVAETPVNNPIQLTANPQDRPVIGSAISPDGKYLAYVQIDGLYLRLIESGESFALELPEGVELDNAQVDWFPSGTHLLLKAQLGATSKLWKLAIVGGRPGAPIAESVFVAAISHDGSRIAYLPSRLSNEVWAIGPNGENPERLVKSEIEDIWQLGWSPDGRFLLFGGGIAYSQTLRAIEVSTGQVSIVMQDNRTFQNWRGYLPFVWASDGSLYYARRNLPPSESMSNLWKLDLDSDTAAIRSEPIQLTNITGLNFRDISLTADAARIAFLLEVNQADVYVSELVDGGKLISGTDRLTYDERDDYPGGWSMDSRHIYFTSDRGASENLFTYDLENDEISAVTGSLVESDDNSEVSPDGAWLLYWDLSSADGEEKLLWRMPVDGGSPELVLSGDPYADFHCPQLSGPAADCVLGTRESGNQYSFYHFDPEYGLGKKLVSIDDRLPFTNWDLSPDGKTAAVVHNSGPARLIDLDTGAEREVSKEGWILGEFVAWTSDGKGLIMDGSSSSALFRKSLVHFDLETGDATVIRRQAGQWHVRPKVSPDGTKVAYGLMVFSGNAWMIENR